MFPVCVVGVFRLCFILFCIVSSLFTLHPPDTEELERLRKKESVGKTHTHLVSSSSHPTELHLQFEAHMSNRFHWPATLSTSFKEFQCSRFNSRLLCLRWGCFVEVVRCCFILPCFAQPSSVLPLAAPFYLPPPVSYLFMFYSLRIIR